MLLAKDFRDIARDSLTGKWGLAVGTGVVASLLGAHTIFSNTLFRRASDSKFLGSYQVELLIIYLAFLFLYSTIGGAVELGYCQFNIKLIEKKPAHLQDLFSRFYIFWKAFGLRLYIFILTLLWTLLLIIPGIIASLSYAMAPFILSEDPSMSIQEAIDYSKELMNGNKWRLFCLIVSFIGWMVLCAFTLGIGYLWLKPYQNASLAAFYLEISGKNVREEA